MRNGLLGAVGVLLTGANLALAQVPYGYAPAIPPSYPQYGYPGYGYGYNYSPGYAPGYGYAAQYYPGMPMSPAGPYPSNAGPVRATTFQTPSPTGEPPQDLPEASPPASTQLPDSEVGLPDSVPSATIEPTPSPALPPAAPVQAVLPASNFGNLPGQGSCDGSCGHDGCCEHLKHHSSHGAKQPCFWISAEYLKWWVKEAPAPPLVTQGDTTVTTALFAAFGVGRFVNGVFMPLQAGALGVPGTQQLNPDSFNFGAASGTRLTAGAWLDSSNRFGVEGSFFELQHKTTSFSAGYPNFPPGTATGGVLAVPFYNAATGFEDAIPLSGVGVAGTASIQNEIFLWGAEGNALLLLTDNGWFSLGGLAGLRYLDLSESLDYITTSNSAVVGVNSFATADRFQTRNQFYGMQLGARAEAFWHCFFVNLTGKAAIGAIHQMVNINGNGTLLQNLAAGSVSNLTAGGIFAQNSNSGPHSQDQFAVVPEVQAQMGWQPWNWVRFTAGYNFLYVSSVVRPGDQIDRSLNPNNFASNLLLAAVPGFTAPYRPTTVFNTSSFWAHGVNVGVEFRY